MLLHECSGICVEENIQPCWMVLFSLMTACIPFLCVLTTAWIPLHFPRPSINTCHTQLSQNISFPLKPQHTLPSYSQLHSLLTHVVIQPLGKIEVVWGFPSSLTLHLLPTTASVLLYSVFLPIILNDLSIYSDYILMHSKLNPPNLVAYNNKHEWSHRFCTWGIESLSWIVLIQSLLCSCD